MKMNNVNIRISDETHALANAVARARPEKPPQVLRMAIDIGLRVLAISTMPDEKGQYGQVSSARLASELRPYALTILDFLTTQGQSVSQSSSPFSSSGREAVRTVQEIVPSGSSSSYSPVSMLDEGLQSDITLLPDSI